MTSHQGVVANPSFQSLPPDLSQTSPLLPTTTTSIENYSPCFRLSTTTNQHVVGIRHPDKGLRPYPGGPMFSVTRRQRDAYGYTLVMTGYCDRGWCSGYPGVYVRRRKADEKGRGASLHLPYVHWYLALASWWLTRRNRERRTPGHERLTIELRSCPRDGTGRAEAMKVSVRPCDPFKLQMWL